MCAGDPASSEFCPEGQGLQGEEGRLTRQRYAMMQKHNIAQRRAQEQGEHSRQGEQEEPLEELQQEPQQELQQEPQQGPQQEPQQGPQQEPQQGPQLETPSSTEPESEESAHESVQEEETSDEEVEQEVQQSWYTRWYDVCCQWMVVRLLVAWTTLRNAARRLPTPTRRHGQLAAVAALALTFRLILNKMYSEPAIGENTPYKIWSIVYLSSFSIHFGSQVWMTLVSGIILYFSLPRHMFGKVQEHLFPAYFAMNSIVSFFMLVSYIQALPELQFMSEEFRQIIAMLLTFVIEAYIRLVVAHRIVMLNHSKNRMEAAAGAGQEIGRHIVGDLTRCPHYMGILTKFRRTHKWTGLFTLATVGLSGYESIYLAYKICI